MSTFYSNFAANSSIKCIPLIPRGIANVFYKRPRNHCCGQHCWCFDDKSTNDDVKVDHSAVIVHHNYVYFCKSVLHLSTKALAKDGDGLVHDLLEVFCQRSSRKQGSTFQFHSSFFISASRHELFDF